jgi:hypothetical protein
MTSVLNLKATRGDTWYWEFTVLQRDNETPQDITGASFRFTAKYKTSDADSSAPIVGTNSSGECQVIDAPNGILTVKIPPAQTALVADAPTSLRYDLQATDGAGNVYTVSRGRIDVEADISLTQP